MRKKKHIFPPFSWALIWGGFFLLVSISESCSYPQPQITDEMPSEVRDSLLCLYKHHYTYGSNLEVMTDSTRLEYLPIKEKYVTLYKGDRVVVAELAIHSHDSIDSIWVKLAHSQKEQAWIRESELKRDFAPTDSLSQAIHLFSKTHASYFIMIFALFVSVFLFRTFRRKQMKMVYFNDIDSAYPLLLCLLVAFSATIYESMQMFVPEMWEHFYFNPTLSPWNVPFLLSIFLTSFWLILIMALATLEDLFHQLSPATAIFYLLGLMSSCIFCYFFFILSTHIYLGYPFLMFFTYFALRKIKAGIKYKYQCGQCGEKLKKKGKCPHCGAINQ